HVRLQRTLAPGAAAELGLSLSPRRYRMRLEGEERYGYLDVAPSGAAALEWKASDAPGERVVATMPTVSLHNDAGRETRFIVEEAEWRDVALRPGRLLSFQDFRDLFSEEYLGADVQLANR